MPVLFPPLMVLMQQGATKGGYGSDIILIGSLVLMGVVRRLGKWWYMRQPERSDTTHFLNSTSDSSIFNPRISCGGTKRELSRLRFANADFFEPFVVRYAFLGSGWKAIIATFVTFALMFLAWGQRIYLLMLLPLVATGILLGILRAFSSLIRVVPGRIEVLSSSVLAPSFEVSRTINLRETWVACSFRTREIWFGDESHIESHDTDMQSHPGYSPLGMIIDLRRVAQPHALVEAVVRAALCRSDAPILDCD